MIFQNLLVMELAVDQKLQEDSCLAVDYSRSIRETRPLHLQFSITDYKLSICNKTELMI